jgi:hypothetical protein
VCLHDGFAWYELVTLTVINALFNINYLGSDLELIELVHTLLGAVGRPTKVSTGKTMF